VGHGGKTTSHESRWWWWWCESESHVQQFEFATKFQSQINSDNDSHSVRRTTNSTSTSRQSSQIKQ
jgi:hypothetical protein